MIAHLKDQLQEMKAKTSMEGKYIKKDAEVNISYTHFSCALVVVMMWILCRSKKYPCPPHGGLWKFQGGRGTRVSKPKYFKEDMNLHWNFWRGGG